MGKGISGGGGMGLVARIAVDADLNPFQQQVDEAVQNALVKFGILRGQENGKFEKAVGDFKQTVKKEVDHADEVITNWVMDTEQKVTKVTRTMTTLGKMALRSLISETMQTFNLISQVTGWGKNQTYQMISGMIQGVISLASAMSLAGSSAMALYGPVLGPIYAAWNYGNAFTAFAFANQARTTQAALENNADDMGNMLTGVGVGIID